MARSGAGSFSCAEMDAVDSIAWIVIGGAPFSRVVEGGVLGDFSPRGVWRLLWVLCGMGGLRSVAGVGFCSPPRIVGAGVVAPRVVLAGNDSVFAVMRSADEWNGIEDTPLPATFARAAARGPRASHRPGLHDLVLRRESGYVSVNLRWEMRAYGSNFAV